MTRQERWQEKWGKGPQLSRAGGEGEKRVSNKTEQFQFSYIVKPFQLDKQFLQKRRKKFKKNFFLRFHCRGRQQKNNKTKQNKTLFLPLPLTFCF